MAKPNAQCLAYSVCITQLNLLYVLENMFCCTQQLASYYVRHYYMSSADWKAAITAYIHTWCMLLDVRTFVHTWSQSCYSTIKFNIIHTSGGLCNLLLVL